MEAKELDSIFRTKLDELEQVPDLVWDNHTAWNKIGPKVKTGWGKFWTWGIISTVVFIGGLVCFINPVKIVAPKTAKVINEVSVLPSKKVDTLVKLDEKPLLPKERLLKNITAPSQNISVEVLDTVSKPKRFGAFGKKAKEYWLIEPRLHLKRSGKGLPLSHWFLVKGPKSPIGFYMPQTPVLRLQIGNALNLSNAFKLFETVQDQGASFRYSYEYSPNPFANSLVPFQKQDPRVIYINDYDK